MRALAAIMALGIALGGCSSKPSTGGLIFVADTNGRDVAVLDGDSFKVLNRIALPGKPHGVDLEPGGRRVWASNIEGGSVSVIDVASRRIVATIKTCKQPVAVAFARGKAFGACGDGYMAVIGLKSLKVGRITPIGFAPHEIYTDPRGRVWSVNRGTNDLSLIDPGTGSLVSRHPAAPYPYGAAFTPDGKYVFVTSKRWNAVSVLSTDDMQILGSVKTGIEPSLVVVSPNGRRVYLTNRTDGTVSVINAITFQVIATIRVEREPDGIAISPDGSLVLVTDFASDDLSLIETNDDRVVRTVPVGDGPDDVVIVPRG